MSQRFIMRTHPLLLVEVVRDVSPINITSTKRLFKSIRRTIILECPLSLGKSQEGYFHGLSRSSSFIHLLQAEGWQKRSDTRFVAPVHRLKFALQWIHLQLAHLPFHRYGQDSAQRTRRDGIPVQQVLKSISQKAKKLQIFLFTPLTSPPPEDMRNNRSSGAQEHYVQ